MSKKWEVGESHIVVLLTCDCRLRRANIGRQSQPRVYILSACECFANPEKMIFHPPFLSHGIISRLVTVAPPVHPSHVQSTWRDLHSTLLESRVKSSFHDNNAITFTENEAEWCQNIETPKRRGFKNTRIARYCGHNKMGT